MKVEKNKYGKSKDEHKKLGWTEMNRINKLKCHHNLYKKNIANDGYYGIRSNVAQNSVMQIIYIYVKKHIKEVSSVGTSASSDTEPDFGNWLAGKSKKTWQVKCEESRDAWFRNGGYIQTEFPQSR